MNEAWPSNPPRTIAGLPVVELRDYHTSRIRDLRINLETETSIIQYHIYRTYAVELCKGL